MSYGQTPRKDCPNFLNQGLHPTKNRPLMSEAMYRGQTPRKDCPVFYNQRLHPTINRPLMSESMSCGQTPRKDSPGYLNQGPHPTRTGPLSSNTSSVDPANSSFTHTFNTSQFPSRTSHQYLPTQFCASPSNNVSGPSSAYPSHRTPFQNLVTQTSMYPSGNYSADLPTHPSSRTPLHNLNHLSTNPATDPSAHPSQLPSAFQTNQTPSLNLNHSTIQPNTHPSSLPSFQNDFQNIRNHTPAHASDLADTSASAHLFTHTSCRTPLLPNLKQPFTHPPSQLPSALQAKQTSRNLPSHSSTQPVVNQSGIPSFQIASQNILKQTSAHPSIPSTIHPFTDPSNGTPLQNLTNHTFDHPAEVQSRLPSAQPSCLQSAHHSADPSRFSSSSSTVPRTSHPSSVRSSRPPSNTSILSSDQTSARQSDVSDTESDMVQEDVATLRQRQEDVSDIDTQVYMSVVWQGGRIGVAYYDIDTMQIYLMLDTEETDNFTILKRALHQLQPEKVVASSKQDERLVKFLKQSLTPNEDDRGSDIDVDVLQFLPNVDFSLEICKRRLLSLDLPSLPNHYTDAERTIYMSSLVPFDNVCMVRAAGGLLKFLEKMRIGVELEDADMKVPVMAIKIFTLEDQMILDDTSYSALQIFYREAHPSVYKSGSGSKEGLSLFGILNRCRSQIGSKMLRLWFLRPLKNVEMLRQRHEAIEFFMQSRNIEVLTTLSDCLKHIKNIPRIISRMLQAQASVGDWQALYKTTYHAIYIRDLCRAQPQDIDIFKKISTSFSEPLRKIATLISRIVDFEESAVQNHFVVKTNVDADLDEKKRTYNGLPDFMTKVAREELNRLTPDIMECNIIYLPQIGYLLAIPQTENNKNNYKIDGLEFIFLSNKILHYRSASTKELDRLLGDTMCDITDRETTILHGLQNIILEHSDVLYVVMDLAAELDCVMALATCAREFNYVKPALAKECVLDIKGARHPLQELCCTPFVPNDYSSGGGRGGRVKVLTGPNACGKSVYLKQIALIVYMAQIGSFVPAESAVIGMVDRIFTRVKSLESVSVGLSTFMLDINQMAESLRSATERSLVIVDEFGKGTETIDGLSLLCSCLKYWLAQADHCPHVLMSTHFHSLVHQKMLPKSNQLQFLTLETLHNGEELVFLYQMVEGHTTSSYASHTATEAGLPQDIVHRGTQVSELLRQCKPVHRLDTADSTTQLKRCEMIVDRFLQLDMESDDLKSFLKDFVLGVSRENN